MDSPNQSGGSSGPKSDDASASDDGVKSTSCAYPTRNLDRLYCPAIAYLCAIGALPSSSNDYQHGQGRPCVPCAYKICNFDIALDSEFAKSVPNQRPEQCPRSISSRGEGQYQQKYDANTSNNNLDGTMGYHRGMNVLTVGDGDFTFSSAVAHLVLVVGNMKQSKNKSSKDGMVVATSYEDYSTLKKVYPRFDNTLHSLKSSREEGKVIMGYCRRNKVK